MPALKMTEAIASDDLLETKYVENLSTTCSTIDTELMSSMSFSTHSEVSDDRTTVMIRDIPCKYTQENLMKEVCSVTPEFNFLYMPPARLDGGCKGYAFVNFCSPAAAAMFISDFEGHVFYKQPNSLKRASVHYANYQGLAKNVMLFQKTKLSKQKFRPYISREGRRMLFSKGGKNPYFQRK